MVTNAGCREKYYSCNCFNQCHHRGYSTTFLLSASCAHISTQHLVATRRSRSQPAQRHTSTITSCSSVQKVYTPTRSSMRSVVTAQCVVENLLKSPFRGVGRWSASSRRWLKDKTCTCELGICYPYLDVSPARSRSLRCRRQ
jgi:hypothetical protein